MVEALCSSSSALRARVFSFFAGLVLTLAWLGLVRFGTPLVLKSWLIPWTLAILSTAAVLLLERTLHPDEQTVA